MPLSELMCHNREHAPKSQSLQTLTLTFLVLYSSNLSPEMIALSAPASLKAIIEVPYQTSILLLQRPPQLTLSVCLRCGTRTCTLPKMYSQKQRHCLVHIWDVLVLPALAYVSDSRPLWLCKPCRNKFVSYKSVKKKDLI